MSSVETLQDNEVKISKAVTLTPAAVIAVQDLIKQQDVDDYALRVFVQGGGCSGVQFGMALENNIHETDLVFDQQDVQVVVDDVSIDYWRGATIDFIDDGIDKGFKIDNPNPINSGCGCGSDTSTSSSDGCGNGSCGCG
ncbi:MAG: iron-sulfur cluster assembly accessory protein [Anaerolineae bacterium]|nr:iron-sulfur cluster assembly accessory protein [Anaerolineae bacterium]